MQSSPPECPVEHLFLLIGKNPLPNYVAARLLAGPQTHVYLVDSSETEPITQKLKVALGLDTTHCTRVPVTEANPSSIYEGVLKYAIGKTGLGLNYTGGTKTMAVHAYQAICDASDEPGFSYLDARRLEIVLHGKERYLKRQYVGDSASITVEELAGIHGIPSVVGVRKPIQADLCRAIAGFQCKGDKFRGDWSSWVNKNGCKDLPSGDVFNDVLSVMEKICGDLGLTGKNLADKLGKPKLSSLKEWFNGKWLESYVLDAIIQLTKGNGMGHLSDYGMNFECKGYAENTIKDVKFEFDVALILGYQLFAISCTVSNDKGKCKQKLFEAYIRARQVGGEEAAVCLVSGDENPEDLQKEVEKSWDAQGAIRVLGVRHWSDLPACLEDWIVSRRRER
ncbi:MAG: hypothetical protein M0Z41_03110 [Peptococcaceae bacterium]|jgi:hypothetical protein|nr:hypothetical protein [Peptococcaceae bacterium]